MRSLPRYWLAPFVLLIAILAWTLPVNRAHADDMKDRSRQTENTIETALHVAGSALGYAYDAPNPTRKLRLVEHALPSLRLARARALSLRVVSLDALLLFADLHERQYEDIYDDRGQTAVRRIRANRARANLPLRDRGIARHR